MTDYGDAVAAAMDAGRGKCPKCWGSGKVAGGTDDLDAWFGTVYPITCPACSGTGRGPDSWEAEVAILASVVARTGGRFTDGEKAHWTARLVAALEKDSEGRQ